VVLNQVARSERLDWNYSSDYVEEREREWAPMEWEDMAVIILGSLSSLSVLHFPYLHFRSSSVVPDWFYGHSQRFRSNALLLERGAIFVWPWGRFSL
jgi:hypothetical protein